MKPHFIFGPLPHGGSSFLPLFRFHIQGAGGGKEGVSAPHPDTLILHYFSLTIFTHDTYMFDRPPPSHHMKILDLPPLCQTHNISCLLPLLHVTIDEANQTILHSLTLTVTITTHVDDFYRAWLLSEQYNKAKGWGVVFETMTSLGAWLHLFQVLYRTNP